MNIMTDQINFIHIPKNAGSSIQYICGLYSKKIKYNWHGIDVHNKNIMNQLVVVQNPISRFESAVRFALQKWSHSPHIKYLINKKIDTPDKWITIWRNVNHPEYKNLMKEIKNIDHMIGNKLLEYKWTYSPQVNYINDPKYVILMENLDQELGLIFRKMGIRRKIPAENVTKKNKKDTISKENLLWLMDAYKDDFLMYYKYKNLPVEYRMDFS
jgi:hypothetical protein